MNGERIRHGHAANHRLRCHVDDAHVGELVGDVSRRTIRRKRDPGGNCAGRNEAFDGPSLRTRDTDAIVVWFGEVRKAVVAYRHAPWCRAGDAIEDVAARAPRRLARHAFPFAVVASRDSAPGRLFAVGASWLQAISKAGRLPKAMTVKSLVRMRTSAGWVGGRWPPDEVAVIIGGGVALGA